MKPLTTFAATLGAALLSASAFTAQAGQNPFAAQELSSGYSLAAHEKGHEGSCGEGKCGGDAKTEKVESEGKCGEGKCGAASEKKAEAEGKCGEGKCGAEKA